jgi:hypothetical protein
MRPALLRCLKILPLRDPAIFLPGTGTIRERIRGYCPQTGFEEMTSPTWRLFGGRKITPFDRDLRDNNHLRWSIS